MTPTPWRFLHDGAATAAWNMAVDEALLASVARGASLPVLRLYRWQPAAVTLGAFQRGAAVVNRHVCRELGLDVVRRCTGGRAVLHEHEATYAVVAPDRTNLFPGSIAGNYRVIARVLDEALQRLGLVTAPENTATPLAPRSAVEASACFSAPAPFEQVVKCCKITGSAQRRSGGAFLQHGSLPVELDVQRLFRALDCEGRLTPAAGGAQLAQRVGWLNRYLPQPVTVAEVETALKEAFAASLALELLPSQLSAAEHAHATQLHRDKYAQPHWNDDALC